MTNLYFTFETKEIQNLIDKSVKNDLSKTILTTVFNQLMEVQCTQYIQTGEYERSDGRTSQRNGYTMKESGRAQIGTLTLAVPRTHDRKFSPDVFDRYQRNKKALLISMLEMYGSGVSTREVS